MLRSSICLAVESTRIFHGNDMRELLIATRNEGKLNELRILMENAPFKVVGLTDVGIGKEAEETALTFEGNAIIKAMTYGKWAGILTISDDSGLEIDALGGRPGVYTKQYEKENADHGFSKIFSELKDVPDEKRGAQFHCVIALYDPATDRVYTCEGIARGKITHEPRGANNFGQDPIFLYDESGKTGGEMTVEEKNVISHRAIALKKAREILLKEFV